MQIKPQYVITSYLLRQTFIKKKKNKKQKGTNAGKDVVGKKRQNTSTLLVGI